MAKGEEKLVCRRKVLAEKGGGTVTTIVEKEGGNCLLIGRENREFVFN